MNIKQRDKIVLLAGHSAPSQSARTTMKEIIRHVNYDEKMCADYIVALLALVMQKVGDEID